MRTRVFLAALLAFAALAPAAAAEQRASLAEIEKQVMCPVCGTLLQLAESPQAQREKAFVKRLIDEGKTEDQIKDALVAEYGEEVLALPPDSGFSLSAYLVPIIAFLIAAVALAIGVWRWRRAGGPRTAARRGRQGRAAMTPIGSTRTSRATTSNHSGATYRCMATKSRPAQEPSTAMAPIAGSGRRRTAARTSRPLRPLASPAARPATTESAWAATAKQAAGSLRTGGARSTTSS